MRQAERDAGHSPGLKTDERERLKDLEDVEFATLERVWWFNHHRLLGPIRDVPPAELEEQYYRSLEFAPAALATLNSPGLRQSRRGSVI